MSTFTIYCFINLWGKGGENREIISRYLFKCVHFPMLSRQIPFLKNLKNIMTISILEIYQIFFPNFLNAFTDYFNVRNSHGAVRSDSLYRFGY